MTIDKYGMYIYIYMYTYVYQVCISDNMNIHVYTSCVDAYIVHRDIHV